MAQAVPEDPGNVLGLHPLLPDGGPGGGSFRPDENSLVLYEIIQGLVFEDLLQKSIDRQVIRGDRYRRRIFQQAGFVEEEITGLRFYNGKDLLQRDIPRGIGDRLR